MTMVVERVQTESTGYSRLLSRKEELEARLEALWQQVERLKSEGRPYRRDEERLLRLLESYEKLCDTIARYYQE